MTQPKKAPPKKLRLQPIPAEKRTGAVVDQLTELILSGVLPPGSSLPSERELSSQLGVSRNVLREATKTLQSRGMLIIRHGARTTVSDQASQSVQHAVSGALYGQDDALLQLTEVRLTLEVSIASLAASRATETDVEALSEIISGLQIHVGETARYAELDVEFHRAIAEATHNSIFVLLLDSVAGLMRQSRDLALVYSRPKDSLPDHERIFKAIEKRDSTRAASAMRKHLQLQQKEFEELFRAKKSKKSGSKK